MMGTKNYEEILHQQLQNPQIAAEYLSAAIEDGEMNQFLLALKSITDAHGGIGVLSEITDLNRQSLYKMLSEEGNPTLASLLAILKSMGIKLVFQAEEKEAA